MIFSLALVAVVATLLVYVRFDAVGYLRDHGLEGCRGVDGDRCTTAAMNAFASKYRVYVSSVIPFALLGLPVLLGIFAGAPLFAREFEQGTHIFALSQSVGRSRWWAVKVLVAGLPVVLAMLGLGLTSSWVLRPLTFATYGRMVTPGFETQGLVLAAYATVAFAIGSTIGTLSRSTVVAMAGTIALYLVLLVGIGGVARARYLAPVEKRGSVAEGAAFGSDGRHGVVPEGAWTVGSSYYDASGMKVRFDPSSCLESDSSSAACLDRQGIVSLSVRFHPDRQFWSFQLIEAGIFAGLGAALLAAGFLGLRRRLL
jgi:hypothetical protein